jgi:tetratricopeptide (TPR) repeat protein
MRRSKKAVLAVFLALAAALPAHGADDAKATETRGDFVSGAVAALSHLKGMSAQELLDSDILDISLLAGRKLLEGKKYLNNQGWSFNGGASFSPGNIGGFTAEMQEEAGGEVSAAVGAEIGADVFVPVSNDEIVSKVGASGKLVVNSASRSLGVEFSGGFTKTVRGKGYDVKIERVLVFEQLYSDDESYQKAMPHLSEDTDLLEMGMTEKVMNALTSEKGFDALRAGQGANPLQMILKKAAIADTDILKFDRTRVSAGYRMVLLTPQGLPVPDPARVLSAKDLAKLIPAQLSGGIMYMKHYEQAADQPIGSGDVYGSIGRAYNFSLGAEKVGVNVGVAKSVKTLKFGRERTDEHLQMLRLADMIRVGDYEAFAGMIKSEAMPFVYQEKVRKARALLKKFGKAAMDLDPSRMVANGVVIHYNPALFTSGRPPGEVARLLAELADSYEGEGNGFMLQAGPGRRRLKVISLRKLLADRAARTVGDLTRIRGYIVDPDGDILLIGEADRFRPKIDINVLYVAAQSVLSPDSQYALVSLDPDPRDMEGPHKVRIEGLPEKLRNTEYARIMIEADYQMKRVNHGDVPVASPGFKSAYQLVREQQPTGARLSRYWLKPYQSRAADIWEHEQGGRTVVMFDSRVLVMTESMQRVGSFLRQTGRPDPICERSASLFTEHYSTVAEQEEIFHKLSAVFDATKLCSIWRHKGVEHPVLAELLRRNVETVTIQEAYQGLKAKEIYVESDSSRGASRVATLRLVGGATAELKLSDKSFLGKPFLAGLLKAGAGDRIRVQLPTTTLLTPRQLNDQSVDMQLGRGIHLYSNLQFEEAVQAFDRAIELDPECLPAYIHRGMSRVSLGQKAEALQAFDRIVAIEPLFKGIRAWLRALSGDAKGALEDAAATEKLFPREEAALAPCAFARLHAFDMRGAERTLHQAMDLNPTDTTLIGIQSTLVLLHALGPDLARQRVEQMNAMPMRIIDTFTKASASLQSMDFSDAIKNAERCLELIAVAPEQKLLAEVHMTERAMLILAMAYSAQARMAGLMDPEQGESFTDKARRQWDALIRLHPDWPVPYLMKARMAPDDAGAMAQAVKAFLTAVEKGPVGDPLLDDIKAITGNDRALIWLGLMLWEKMADKKMDEAKTFFQKIVEMLGDSRGGKLLRLVGAQPSLGEIRRLYAELPEKLVDPDPVEVWCVTIFSSLIVALESERGDRDRAIEAAGKFLRMTNVEGLDLVSLQLLASYRMGMMRIYDRTYKPSFDNDPRMTQLRTQIANGKMDLAEIRRALDAIQASELEEVEKEMSPLTAAFMNFTKVLPLRLETERALLRVAEQYIQLDARDDDERRRLQPVVEQWGKEIDRRDRKKGQGKEEDAFRLFATLMDAARTTVDIHGVRVVIDSMQKSIGILSSRDPAVAAKMHRVMARLQTRLRAKTVTAKRKKLSWEGWPTAAELMAASAHRRDSVTIPLTTLAIPAAVGAIVVGVVAMILLRRKRRFS